MSSELIIDGETVNLGPGTKVGVTFQVNDLAELKGRKATFTNTFETPLTKRNKEIYGNVHTITTESDKAYRRLPAQFIQDGVQLVSNGYAEFKETGKSIRQTIYGGLADVFSRIKGKRLRDLDLSAYDHTWDLATIFASRVNTSGYIYSLIDWSDDSDTLVSPYMGVSTRDVDVRLLKPAMFMHTVMEKIFSEAGYTISGNILSQSRYTNHLLPFAPEKMEYDEDYVSSHNFKVRFRKNTNYSSNSGVTTWQNNVMSFQDETTQGYYDNANAYDPATGNFTAPTAGYYDFTAYVNYIVYAQNNSINSNHTFQIRKLASTVLVKDQQTYSGFHNTTLTINTGPVYLQKGDKVQVRFRVVVGGTAQTVVNQDAYFKGEMQSTIAFGGDMFMSGTLPDMTQDVFVKAMAQLYGIIFVPDNLNKIVYFRQFSDLYANIPKARNMSAKLNDREPAKVTTLPTKYAKRNWMRYQENTNGTVSGIVPPQGRGDGCFYINNENLEEEKTLFTLPFHASVDVARLNGLSVCLIPKHHAGAIANQTGPRMVMLNRQNITGGDIVYTDPTTPATLQSSTDIPLTYFIDDSLPDSLGFDRFRINADYRHLVEYMLNNYKEIDAPFKFDPQDLEDFDHMIPFYIDKYAAYFFVNKIENYIKGQDASTQLIRM